MGGGSDSSPTRKTQAAASDASLSLHQQQQRQTSDDDFEKKLHDLEQYLQKSPSPSPSQLQHTAAAATASATATAITTISADASHQANKANREPKDENGVSRFVNEWISFTTDCFVYGLIAGAGYAYVNRSRLMQQQEAPIPETAKVSSSVSSSGSGKPNLQTMIKSLTNRQRVSSLMLTHGTKFALNALLFGAPFFCIDFYLWKWQLQKDGRTMAATDPVYIDRTISEREEIAHRMWHRGLAGAFSGSLFGVIGTFRESMKSKVPVIGYSAAMGASVGMAYAMMQKVYFMTEQRVRGGYTQREIGEMKKQMEEKELQRSIRDIIDTEMKFSETELTPEKIQKIQQEYLEEREQYLKRQQERMQRDMQEIEQQKMIDQQRNKEEDQKKSEIVQEGQAA